jgi:DNA-directed RNA polymerase specialized sigma24 family protein
MPTLEFWPRRTSVGGHLHEAALAVWLLSAKKVKKAPGLSGISASIRHYSGEEVSMSNHLPKEQVAAILDLLLNGCPAREIAARTGINLPVTSHYVRIFETLLDRDSRSDEQEGERFEVRPRTLHDPVLSL